MSGPTIQETMQSNAQAAVSIARQRFGIRLDFSEESMMQVEDMLDQLHKSLSSTFINRLLRRGPSQATFERLANQFGAYIGEVMR